MSKTLMFQVALAILAGKNHLLVVEKEKNQLDLPGNTTVPGERAVETVKQLLAKLGLEQMPRQILYLPNFNTVTTKQLAFGLVGLVHLKRPRRIDVPLSRFESTEKLRSMKYASPLLQAVLKWLFS